jgi:hypothetical protein
MTSGKNLVPYFTAEGEIFIDDALQQSGVNSIDFSSLVRYTVRSLGGEKRYTVQVSSFTGLPMVFINTEDNKPIDSKDDYVKTSIRIVGAPNIDDFSREISDKVKIKGRGNSTWTMDKKPYKIKFDKKESLLGEPEDKEWVLLANYADKTSLRNETAFFMGRLSENLAWTPRTHFVEVFINEVYNGTYQLCEQVKIAKSRVNVSDDGYLLEVDAYVDQNEDIFFQANSGLLFNIKEPEMKTTDAQYTWIKNYVAEVENLLYASNFNPETGYAKYVDIPSFVDWYLINEIVKNVDGKMYSSCYMNIAPNGKLKMGPLWDFDLTIGNYTVTSIDGVTYHCEDPTGLYIANAPWFKQLMKDPVFKNQVKERFDYFKSKKTDILANINSKATYLKYSIIENNNRWQTLYTQISYTIANYAIWGAYENEVKYMKNWLDNRIDTLEQEFAKM